MAKKSKKKDGMELSLEGKVFILDTKDGKTTKEELDGELVLKCVMEILKKSLDK